MERVNFIANGSKCGIKFGDTMRRSQPRSLCFTLDGESVSQLNFFFLDLKMYKATCHLIK